jgi:UDP-GlcNAc:undecaprenyl-phosphate GlcNAc-1-phosphate transferase
LDGLAAGLGFFATVTTLIAALLHNNLVLAVAAAPLAGCLLAFLRYNFNPASIFLGDSGSLFVGFLLGCFGVIWSQKCGTVLALTAPLMALSIPLLDTILAISRRFIRLQPIFGADSDHIHHRLLKRGVKPRAAAVLLYLLAGIAAAFSLLQSLVHDEYKSFIIVMFSVAVWLGIHSLAYIEFDVVRRLFFGGGFRRVLQGEVCLRVLGQSLASACTIDDCWKVIRDSGKALGFSRVSLEINGASYEEFFDRAPRDNCWNLRVPLSHSDYVEFALEFHSPSRTLPLASFVHLVRTSLQSQLRSSLSLIPPSTTLIEYSPFTHDSEWIPSSQPHDELQIPLHMESSPPLSVLAYSEGRRRKPSLSPHF